MDIKQVFPTKTSGASMPIHSDQQALLAAIITNPDEDAPRSMYADSLQDSDDTLDRKLGEYIKLSLELHTHKRLPQPRRDNTLKGIEYRDDGSRFETYGWYRRGIELRKQINDKWLEGLQNHPSFLSIKANINVPRPWFEFEVDRGFISSIICTATQFLEVCDKLIWHPSMVDECEECNGFGYTKDCIPYADRIKCRRCTKGKIARPCPLTAHPVRGIEITSMDNLLNRGGHNRAVDILEWQEVAPKYGIEFTIV